MRNYFTVKRDLLQSDRWLSEQFSRGQAWVDLFGLANYTDGYIRVRGTRINIKRGQLGWSQRALADRWKWSRNKVRRYLDELELDGDIYRLTIPQSKYLITLISVVNYNTYQLNDTTDETAEGQQKDSRRYSNNKNKKNKKNNTLATSVAKEKKIKKNNKPVSLEEFCKSMRTSKRKALHIIAEWAETVKPEFSTYGQWQVFMKRNLRPASSLEAFSQNQMEKAYRDILSDSDNCKKFKPTLETIIKYLTK